MSWISMILYFLVFELLLRYPYVFVPLILLYVFRDRIPNPADFFRRRNKISRLHTHLDVNPYDLTARRDLGMLLLDARKPAEARDVLEEAYRKDGDSVEINHLLGLSLIRSGKPADAVGHLKSAVEKEPRFRYGESHLYLGEALLGAGKPEDALGSLKEYMSINSTSIEGLYFLGKTFATLGDKEAAAAAVRDGIKFHKGNPSFRRRKDWRWYVRLKSLKRGL